jgi:hypothetical protein
MSKTINRLLVFCVILLHLAVILSSKFQNFKEKKLKIQISIIYKPEHYNWVGNKNPIVTLGSAIFFSVSTVGAFLVHSGSRESQLYFLLPGQLMLTSIFFPAFIIVSNNIIIIYYFIIYFIIVSNKKVSNQFIQDYHCLKQMWNCLRKDNRIIPSS